ncbi:DUF3900 domain-containing protein [Peribacillus huizhouensis]|uniref:DUF3900 domain-containing protein n=1 Tax=Peribacillus huizhouensis TaxID=1501239 RepID=UPI0015FCB778|nr:DUF3900 domain-containing protein [Peribacillus huizhouensis]
MDFSIQYLSFYVISVEGKGDQADKRYKHFQTLDEEEYENSSLKDFLDGELMKISKRKVDRHPKAEQVPTKIGFFIVEEGHELDSNPNYNLFNRVRFADTKDQFHDENEQFVSAYLDTSAVRGGVFLIASAKLTKYFDEPFVFLLKCDFEPKVASISDEATLIQNVEMAITTKNMKSIQYPYMPEEGMVEPGELKIHQASHARYFEDFLKFVDYGESMPEIIRNEVVGMVSEHVNEHFPEGSDARVEFENDIEIWSASEKRELRERLDSHRIVEAAASMIEITPDLDLKMKLDHISVNGLLSDFGESVHIAKVNDKYVTVIESDSIVFEKSVSPIEFLKPEMLEVVMERINAKNK